MGMAASGWANLAKHGLDFAPVGELFAGLVVATEDSRRGGREHRGSTGSALGRC